MIQKRLRAPISTSLVLEFVAVKLVVALGWKDLKSKLVGLVVLMGFEVVGLCYVLVRSRQGLSKMRIALRIVRNFQLRTLC